MRKTATAEPEKDEKAALVVSPGKRTFFEANHNVHRILTSPGATTMDIEGNDFLSGIRAKVSGGDLAHVFTDDWLTYWQCLVVGSGAVNVLAVGTQVKLVVLPGYPVELPVIDMSSVSDLPAGYKIVFNPGTRRHVPYWGDTPLSADGHLLRDQSRIEVMHHASKAAEL